jgi:TonB family protein
MAGPPAEFHFANWQPRRERAVSSFLLSLGVHSAVVAAIWIVNPRAGLRQFTAPTITQILVEENRQITWYAPKTEMPAVTPIAEPDAKTAAKTPRYQAPQPMQATAPDAAGDKQMIVSDAPEIQFQQDQELPNMLSWQGPKVERPRFQLTAPRPQAPPEPKRVELPPEPPPKIEPAANAGVDVIRFQQIARLRYRARNPEAAEPEQRPVEPEPAPRIAAAPTASEVDASKLQELSRLRFQQEQQRRQAPQQRAVDAEEAPKIEAQSGPGVDASKFSELSRLRYQQGEQQRQAPERRTLSAEGAPALREAPGQPGLDPSQFQQLSRLRYEAGDRGQAKAEPSRQALGAVAEAPAPQIGGGPAGAASVDSAALQDLPRLRYESSARGAAAGPAPAARALGEVAAEAAPAVGGSPGGSASLDEIAKLDLPGAPPPSLGEPGGGQSGGTGGPVNMVVAGVNPADRAPRELPRGSRSGAFSAGPNATPDGGRTAAGGSSSAGLRAPNLSIQGPPSRRTTAPEAADALRRLTRTGGFEQLRPGEAPKIEATVDTPKIDPDTPFVGRPVYTLAINMPNVTSYRGDWVIQFAEALSDEERKQETEDERAARLAKKDDSLTPPYPVVKVDPKYSAEAMREKVEGEVVLYCVIREDGRMTDLQLVEGLDRRLDANAREAFAKWKFEPARKKGTPIAVETLIRIPFRLNPDIKIRY